MLYHELFWLNRNAFCDASGMLINLSSINEHMAMTGGDDESYEYFIASLMFSLVAGHLHFNFSSLHVLGAYICTFYTASISI